MHSDDRAVGSQARHGWCGAAAAFLLSHLSLELQLATAVPGEVTTPFVLNVGPCR